MRHDLETLESRFLLNSTPVELGYEIEPNDTRDTATPLASFKMGVPCRIDPATGVGICPPEIFQGAGVLGNNHSAVQSDVDFFSFPASAGNRIAIWLRGDAVHHGVLANLLDSDGGVVGTTEAHDTDGDGVPDVAGFELTASAGGQFFIQVGPDSNTSDPALSYTVGATVGTRPTNPNVEHEPNNRLAEANPIVLHSGFSFPCREVCVAGAIATTTDSAGTRLQNSAGARDAAGAIPPAGFDQAQRGSIEGTLDNHLAMAMCPMPMCGPDVDFFTFSTDTARKIHLEFTGDAAAAGVLPQLLDAGGSVLATAVPGWSGDGTADLATLDYFTQAGGQFFVQVGPDQHATGGSESYRLGVAVAPDPHHENEPNNDFETADPIFLRRSFWEGGRPLPITPHESALRGYIDGVLNSRNEDPPDKDIYVIEVPAGSTLAISVGAVNPSHVERVTLFNSSGEELVSDGDRSNGWDLQWSTPSGGTFYVSVDEDKSAEFFDPNVETEVGPFLCAEYDDWPSWCFGPTDYRVYVFVDPISDPVQGPDEHEPNDAREQANRLELQPVGQVVCLSLDCPPAPLPGEHQRVRVAKGIAGGPTHDVDFLSFLVLPGEHVSVGLGCVPGFEFDPRPIIILPEPELQPVLFVTVFDEAGNEIGRTGVDGVETILFESERGGVYFARVELQTDAPDAEVTDYELHLHARKFSHEGQDESEPNDTLDQANVLELHDLPLGACCIDVRAGGVHGIAGGPTNDRDAWRYDIQGGEHVTVAASGLLIAAGGEIFQSIDDWIAANHLNKFGDPSDTVYAGGSPLFNERTAKSIDRLSYIMHAHPGLSFAPVQVVVYDADGNEIGRAGSDGTGLKAVEFDAKADATYYGVVSVQAVADQSEPVHYRLGVLARGPFVHPEPESTGEQPPEVVVLQSGGTFDYTDSSGDKVHIVYRGKGGHATITFTDSSADGSDIESVVIDRARANGSLSVQTDGSAAIGSIDVHGTRRGRRVTGGFGKVQIDGNVGSFSSDVNLRAVAVDGLLGQIEARGRLIGRVEASVFDRAMSHVRSIRTLRIEETMADALFHRFLPWEQ